MMNPILGEPLFTLAPTKPTTEHATRFVSAASRLCMGVTLLLLYVLMSGCANHGRNQVVTGSIPQIASIARIRVGYSTQEDLAMQWGEGQTITGGHPNSGRVWRVPGTQWVVHTDGFEYSARGLVVDSLTLDEDLDLGRGAPYARRTRNDFFWLGKISLGMSREKVLDVLQSNSLPVAQTERGFELRARGLHALVGAKLTTWSVACEFSHELLIRLTLNAAEGP